MCYYNTPIAMRRSFWRSKIQRVLLPPQQQLLKSKHFFLNIIRVIMVCIGFVRLFLYIILHRVCKKNKNNRQKYRSPKHIGTEWRVPFTGLSKLIAWMKYWCVGVLTIGWHENSVLFRDISKMFPLKIRI